MPRTRPPKHATPTVSLSLTIPTALVAQLDNEGYGQRSAAVTRILAAHYGLDLKAA